VGRIVATHSYGACHTLRVLWHMVRRAYGGKFPTVAAVRTADVVTGVLVWISLLKLDFVIGWHPYFFAGWMVSACLAGMAQKRWRKAAGFRTDLADYAFPEKPKIPPGSNSP